MLLEKHAFMLLRRIFYEFTNVCFLDDIGTFYFR